MSDKIVGLLHKYDVIRVDGKTIEWAFVLEDKDPLALPALRAYRDAAKKAGYEELAEDLTLKITELWIRHHGQEAAERYAASFDQPERLDDAALVTFAEIEERDRRDREAWPGFRQAAPTSKHMQAIADRADLVHDFRHSVANIEAAASLLEGVATEIDGWFPNDPNPKVQEDMRRVAGVLRGNAEMFCEPMAKLVRKNVQLIKERDARPPDWSEVHALRERCEIYADVLENIAAGGHCEMVDCTPDDPHCDVMDARAALRNAEAAAAAVYKRAALRGGTEGM